MKFTVSNSMLAALCLITGGANAFVPQHSQSVSVVNRGSSALNVNLPRLEIPGAIADKLSDFDLKNPNKLNDDDYRSYSGAAIAGTLVFFLLPGALISGIYGDIGSVAIAALTDFAFSALIGGGLAIYLSLRGDQIGDTVREFGYKLLSAGKDATGIGTFRYDLPAAVTDVMTGQLSLLNPNLMSEKDYDGYSGAAVGGTLVFFLLPGAIVTGAADVLGQFAGTVAVDFIFSALVGGGAAIYLSLRKDEIGATVNQLGGKLLDVVDDVIGADGEKKLLE